MGATIVYDGDCGFCTSCAQWLEARSDADVAPWQRLDLDALGLSGDDVATAAWWVGEDGERRRGERAIAQALRTCGPGWSALGSVIDAPPVRPFAAVGYQLVARFRHRLPGGTPACRLP